MNEEIKEILDRLDAEEFELPEYSSPISWTEMFEIRDYITNLQEKIKHYEETTTFGDYVKEVNLLVDYKLRIEKVDWWLREMLRQAKSDETKAIINGTLELLLNGRSDE